MVNIINSEQRRDTQSTKEDHWRLMYRLRPYLGNADNQALRCRLDDILRNVLNLTPEAKVGMLPSDQGGSIWSQKLIDLHLECFRRSTKIEDIADMSEMPWNMEALELIRRNQHIISHFDKKNIFCKFGKIQWMRELLEHGNLRISPASYYSYSEHNIARRDDELILETYLTPYDYDLGIIPDFLLEKYPERGWGVINHIKPSNHYLYCLTVSFNPRYFFDFRGDDGIADACVIIHNPDEFERRLTAAVSQALNGWHIKTGMAKYVDPYSVVTLLPNHSDEIYFFKPFRFLYQREYRLVAIPPPREQNTLDHLSLRLGSLKDIAELMRVSS